MWTHKAKCATMCVPLQKTVKQKLVCMCVCVQICSTCAYLNVFFYFVCVSLSMCVLCLWNAFKSARKCLGVFQVREFPCSLTRCDSYNWVPFDFCRPAPQPPLPPPLPPSPPITPLIPPPSPQQWRGLLGLCCCDLWVLSSTPICCLSSDSDSSVISSFLSEFDFFLF